MVTQWYVPWRERGLVQYNPLARLVIAVATVVYKIAAPIVRAVPGPILLAAVFVSVVISWGAMELFGLVEEMAVR